jgi:DNA replication protein DnaC
MAKSFSEAMTMEISREDLGTRTETCPTHGAYQSNGTRVTIVRPREFWTGCPQCAAALVAAEQAEVERRKVADQRARLEQMMARSCLPPRFIGRTFDNYEATTPGQQRALRILRAYAERFDNLKGKCLILSGKPGTGKTHLAAAVIQAIQPRLGLYTTMMGMTRVVRGTWRRDSERTELDVITELGTVDLLVIDEVGAQYETEAEMLLFFEIFDRRYSAMKPTILMTNLDLEAFVRVVGDRTFDRLRECGHWVSFTWDSYRSQATKD